MNRAERIRDAAEVLARNPQEAYHTGAMEQLAKEGVPQLLAVFEAAAEYVAAKDALAEADGGDSEASFRASLEHRSRCDLTLRAALAPLLADAQ